MQFDSLNQVQNQVPKNYFAISMLKKCQETEEMAKITMRQAISQALWEEMERDPSVFILGEEVGVWGGTYAVTKGFYDHFGADRVKDTPISEAAIIGGAIGAAMTGLRPVAEMMTINFAFSAFDHIVNQTAKLPFMFGGQMQLPMRSEEHTSELQSPKD